MTISFARHQFPPAIIRHAVWLYVRFTLSYRDVEDLLAERGLDVSYETVRRWVLKFGPLFARELRHRRPRPTARWHPGLDVLAERQLDHDGCFGHPWNRRPELLQRHAHWMRARVRHRVGAVFCKPAARLVGRQARFRNHVVGFSRIGGAAPVMNRDLSVSSCLDSLVAEPNLDKCSGSDADLGAILAFSFRPWGRIRDRDRFNIGRQRRGSFREIPGV